MWKTGVLTISDKGSKGERSDESGKLIIRLLEPLGIELITYNIIPDEQKQIEHALINMCDNQNLDLVVTTGGTGLSPRDVTPEATAAVMERNVPGIAEAMRFSGLKHTPYAILSRGLCVIRKQTLIINLPGSPKAVQQGMEAIINVLPHALSKLKGDMSDCAAS